MPTFSKLFYSRDWRNPEDFPTYEPSEDRVREDMQYLYNEIQKYLNGDGTVDNPGLLEELARAFTDLSAGNVPFTPTAGLPVDNVQAALTLLYEQMTGIVLGAIPDGTLTGAKLTDGAVGSAKMTDGAVTAAKLGASAVTPEKLSVETKSLFATLGEDGKVTPTQTSAAIVPVTASKTLALGDAGTLQRCTNTAALTITIPAAGAVAFPVGTELEIYRAGTGAVSVVGATGVMIECAETSTTIKAQYTRAALKKMADNVWALEGAVG